MTGSSSGVVLSAIRHRHAPFISRHTVRIGASFWSYMMTLFFVKITFQSASQMGPRPIRVWWKDGMTLPDRGKSWGKLGIPNSAEPLDGCSWPLEVPMVIVGAFGSKLIVGAFFEK